MTATADITVRELKDALLVPGTALRFTPPVVQVEEKTSRGLFFSLFPRPTRPQQGSDDGAAGKGKQRVWVLKDDRPVAVVITTGWTSGSLTEVTSGNLVAGTPLVVDILEGAK
jgi:HlyD family secretion protein